MDWTIRDSNLDRSHRFFFSTKRLDRLCGPPSLLFDGYRGVSPGVKRTEREADHSFRDTAKAKKELFELYFYSSYMSSWREKLQEWPKREWSQELRSS